MSGVAEALTALVAAPEGADWAIVGLAVPGICEAAVRAGAASVKGMDPDSSVVAALGREHPDRRIDLDTCHPEALCVRSASVDVALATWGGWEDATEEGVVAELQRVTRPGGVVMLAKPPGGLFDAADERPDGGLLDGWDVVRRIR